MMRIGINLSLMLLRKRKTRFKFVSDQAENEEQSFEIANVCDLAPNPEQLYMSDESRQKLRAAIKGLPAQLNSVFALHYGDDRSLESAATTLGITVAAAKSRMMPAVLSLEEVARLIDAAAGNLMQRALLMTLYGTGISDQG